MFRIWILDGGNCMGKARDRYTAFGFLAPSLVHFLVFVVLPVGFSLYISLTRWDLLTPMQFVGLTNFKELFFNDSLFWLSLRNTAYFVVLTVPPTIALGLLLAMAMSQRIRGIAFFRSIYFIPHISSMVAVAMVWRWIYNYNFGILNTLLEFLGLPVFDWLGDPKLAMPSVAIMSVWKGLGWAMLIYLAGLQNIPPQFYEAAEIDGANAWQRFVYITWPLLTPTTFFILVMSLIGAFQVFDQVYMMTGGGPSHATTVYNYYLFQNAFRFFKMGYAAAMAWILFIIIAVITYLQMKFLGENVNYNLK